MDKIMLDELVTEEFRKRYVMHGPETVLTEARGYAAEIRMLKRELNSILELKAVNNSEVRSGNISDPTGEIATRRADLETRIAVLEQMQNIVDGTLRKLSYHDQELIKLFFFKRGMMSFNVQEYADTHYISIPTVYRERRTALDAFRDVFKQYLV